MYHRCDLSVWRMNVSNDNSASSNIPIVQNLFPPDCITEYLFVVNCCIWMCLVYELKVSFCGDSIQFSNLTLHSFGSWTIVSVHWICNMQSCNGRPFQNSRPSLASKGLKFTAFCNDYTRIVIISFFYFTVNIAN